MEKAQDIAKYLLYLDKDNKIFKNNLLVLNSHNCYEGNVRLNKYLHILQMVYIAMTDKLLFSDDMFAFTNGVVVSDVMNNYNRLKLKRNTYKIEDESIKEYLNKMYDILKYADLGDLIEISHQDEEWQKRHKYYKKSDQIIDTLKGKENYKIMCADFIELLKND